MAANIAHGLSVALLRPLAELLDRLELDGAALLAALDIDPTTAPDTFVDGALVDRELERRAASRGDRAFGLTLARASMVRPLGLFGHMVWLSGTVRDALTRAARYYAVISRRTTLALVDDGARAILRQSPVPGLVRGAILTELAFASLALRARAATQQQFAPRAVRFSHAGDAAHPGYREVFAAPVAFGAPADEIELDAAQLDLALATADPITSAALEVRAAQLAGSPAAARSPLVDRVRRAVAAAPDASAITLDAVARELGTSARSLRRHLAHDASSLRAIVDDVRRERADQLLASGTAVKDVAFQLGFSEPSAFSRAYKRWTGRAPKP